MGWGQRERETETEYIWISFHKEDSKLRMIMVLTHSKGMTWVLKLLYLLSCGGDIEHKGLSKSENHSSKSKEVKDLEFTVQKGIA